MDPMVAFPPMNRLGPTALLLAAALPAFAADAWRPFTATLAPRASHEECVRLGKDEVRRYSWKADAPVDFNVHYHDGPEAIYPLKRDGMRGDGGTFKAKVAQDYCWMWTARDKPAKLEGRLEMGSDPISAKQ